MITRKLKNEYIEKTKKKSQHIYIHEQMVKKLFPLSQKDGQRA